MPHCMTAPGGGLLDMVTVNCPAAPPEMQLMQSEQDSLSIIYCLQSEALGFGVTLESVQNFLVHGECALVLAQSLQDCQHGE